jgi:hypothetical protein
MLNRWNQTEMKKKNNVGIFLSVSFFLLVLNWKFVFFSSISLLRAHTQDRIGDIEKNASVKSLIYLDTDLVGVEFQLHTNYEIIEILLPMAFRRCR